MDTEGAHHGRRWLRFLPMLLVMAAIFYLSSLPGDSIYLPPFPNSDKVAHVLVYAVLAAAVIFAFSPWRRPAVGAILVLVISALYGASDEWHQSFVAGRTMDFFDFLADCFGALIVIGCWLLWRWSKDKNRGGGAASRRDSLRVEK